MGKGVGMVMKRFMIFLGLILLIFFVVLSYLAIIDEGKIWFIDQGDNLIPAGVMERMPKGVVGLLNPASWVFLGILVLVYFKILWKLICFNWKSKNNYKKKDGKIKIKQRFN
ncbi:MAG: hypothetical protein JM58_18030 [Peptococcaceae bacterium BICA1-8]|nr:MAG: hypothetical protein JM58_18030 [Peptococcaceae bacterium BICA1-8]